MRRLPREAMLLFHLRIIPCATDCITRARGPTDDCRIDIDCHVAVDDAAAVAATHYYVIPPPVRLAACRRRCGAVRPPPTRRRGIMRLMPLQHAEKVFHFLEVVRYTLLAGAQHNLSLRCQFKVLHSVFGRWRQFAKCVARSFVLSPKVVESIS